ncbi:hypothetical protein BDK51DRAFT_25976, partial [Blyttiomyces helicus]
IWRYETLTAIWSQLVPRTPPTYNIAKPNQPLVTACVGSTIYGTLPDGTFASYDLNANVWTPLAQPTTTLRGSATYALVNSTIRAVGARSVFQYLASGSCAYPPITSAGGVVVAGVGYVYGGFAGGLQGMLKTLGLDGWSVVADGKAAGSPSLRECMYLAEWNGKIILWGGTNQVDLTDNTLSNSGIWFFAAGSWREQPLQGATGAAAPTLYSALTCSMVASVLYIWSSGSQNTGLLHRLDLQALTWISGPNRDPPPGILTPSVTPTATPSVAANSSSTPSAAVIAGSAAGAALLVALAVIITLLFLRHRRCSVVPGGELPTGTRKLPPETIIFFAPQFRGTARGPARQDSIQEDTPRSKVYRGLCGFQTRARDEVAVKLGDEIVIRSKLADGWAIIDNLTMGTSGLAPLSAIDVGKDFQEGL